MGGVGGWRERWGGVGAETLGFARGTYARFSMFPKGLFAFSFVMNDVLFPRDWTREFKDSRTREHGDRSKSFSLCNT